MHSNDLLVSLDNAGLHRNGRWLVRGVGFSVRRGEIVKRGVKAGPEVARLMQTVQMRWIAEGFPDRERVSAILDEELRS